MERNVCCFFGHRTIIETEELKSKVYEKIEELVTRERVDTFLFGSKGRFNELCYIIVSKIKEKHSHIKRVYVRAEYPIIDDDYKQYLLKLYENTYYPDKILGAGRAVYIKRNFDMIDNSSFCVVYYNDAQPLSDRRSGTKIALEYAVRKKKEIYIFK
ncbi:MAG: hypothetical protein IJC49_03960 [Clostridia bacterium]|nr:hypothetical protein [Clostridia bacterium]